MYKETGYRARRFMYTVVDSLRRNSPNRPRDIRDTYHEAHSVNKKNSDAQLNREHLVLCVGIDKYSVKLFEFRLVSLDADVFLLAIHFRDRLKLCRNLHCDVLINTYRGRHRERDSS